MNLNQDHRFLNAFRKKHDVIEIIMKCSSAQHQSAHDAILCANRSHDDVLQKNKPINKVNRVASQLDLR